LIHGHWSLRTRAIIAAFAALAIVDVAGRGVTRVLHLGPAYLLKAVLLVLLLEVFVVVRIDRGHPHARFGWSNAVTTVRAIGVALVAAFIGEAPSDAAAIGIIAVALAVTLLDGVDGGLARHTGMASTFGARFDMEVDALLIAALSVLTWEYRKAGAWIILSGLLRYLFVAAGWIWTFMQRPLPPRFRRKVICVAQIVGLLLALLPSIHPPASTAIAAVSLALLLWSFGVDTAWLAGARVR
jgi:phosphatidylglycerophosphate synthase